MPLDDSLDSFSGQRGNPWDMTASNSFESVDEIPLICRARDKASCSRGYRLVQ